jgi:hypothetical protein
MAQPSVTEHNMNFISRHPNSFISNPSAFQNKTLQKYVEAYIARTKHAPVTTGYSDYSSTK